MTHIELLEVSPRDGLQNEEMILGVDKRVELISRLSQLGLRRIEAVSFVHPAKVPQMAHAEEVVGQLPQRESLSYSGLVLNRRGAIRALETPLQELNFVIPVTDTFATKNQGRTTHQLLEEASDIAKMSREAGRIATVTLAVAFGCPFEGTVSFDRVLDITLRLLDLGFDEICFADTVGVGGAAQVRALVQLAEDRFSGEILRFHFHNTRNTGYSNAIAAIHEAAILGISVVLDSSLGGFGGCPFAPAATGNISTEDLLYSLQTEGVFPLSSTKYSEVIKQALWLAEQLKKPVQSLLPNAGWFPRVANEEI